MRDSASRPAVRVGVIGVLLVWEIGAHLLAGKHILPTPPQVAVEMWNDKSYYWPNMLVTLREAGKGYLVGNVLAIVMAIAFVQVPVARTAVDATRHRELLRAARGHRADPDRGELRRHARRPPWPPSSCSSRPSSPCCSACARWTSPPWTS